VGRGWRDRPIPVPGSRLRHAAIHGVSERISVAVLCDIEKNADCPPQAKKILGIRASVIYGYMEWLSENKPLR